MNNNRLRAQNVGQPVLFLHCTRSGGISQPALRSPSGGYGCTRPGLRCGGGHAVSRRRECATENSGLSGKTGIFSQNCGDFRGKVARFSPVGGECLLHLGGNDGGLAAKGEREERKPRNTGQNDTKKVPKTAGCRGLRDEMWGLAAETNGRRFGSTLICSRRWSVPCR